MDSKICLAVDSACDLPYSVYKKNDLQVLPVTLVMEGEKFVDDRNPIKMTEFYASDMGDRSYTAETEPFSVEAMSKLIKEKLIYDYDEVLVITINSARSNVFKNVRDAVFVNHHDFKKMRLAAGKAAFFKIRVMDSLTMFTGQGVLVYEAIRLLSSGQNNVSEVIANLELLKNNIYAYVLPKDLFHLKNRASTKGDNSINWLSYQMGNILDVKPIIQCCRGETSPIDKVRGFDKGLVKLFDKAKKAIENKLSINVVVMSYAGNLADIEKNDDYKKFTDFAKGQEVMTLLSVMSTAASINVGPGSFSLAYAES